MPRKSKNEYTDFPVVISSPRSSEKKLGRSGAVGLCYDDGNIEIDPRLSSKEYLDTFIHEMLHHHFPELKEEDVATIGTKMMKELWKAGYRKINK
jgi:hypothetical protein|tara:strand:- start:3262 stop:3546 length:285 start_codon:yes stop_codon:yes gene_type:complete